MKQVVQKTNINANIPELFVYNHKNKQVLQV